MYKKGIYKILANEPLTATVWRMVLGGDTQWITAPGQFVDIALEGRYLRRPISVCDYDATTLTLIYKVVGEGTAQMSRMAAGGELDLLTGLGNGFDVHNAAQRPLLVGGGVGVPPLYNLAKVLLAAGKRVGVVLGFNTADEVFYADEFRALGCDIVIEHLRTTHYHGYLPLTFFRSKRRIIAAAVLLRHDRRNSTYRQKDYA